MRPLAERLWAKVDATGPCWLWTAQRGSDGYGRFQIGRTPRRAHRVVYEILVGEIPPGFELDHLCRVRHCVNPDHLEPVTRRENLRRSPIVLSTVAARQTHCIHGHELTDDNIYRDPSHPAGRWCRKCRTERHRKEKR